MSDLIIKKNGTDYKLPMLAEHYPADRVYENGDINKNLQNKFAIINDTTPSTAGGTKDISFPQGFTKSNSIVLSILVDNGYYVFSSGGGVPSVYALYKQDGTAITLGLTIDASSDVKSKSVKIILMRIS